MQRHLLRYIYVTTVLLTVLFNIVAAKLSNVSLHGTTDKLENLNSNPIQVIEEIARPKTDKNSINII